MTEPVFVAESARLLIAAADRNYIASASYH